MASSLHQWESDPLFSAAEVVQDSADRMESIFRLLLHEQSLLQSDHPDSRLIASTEYHKRDLATLLETAKWQLEDFERAVSSLAMADKSQTKEDVISRHIEFIQAIRGQINHVEKSIEGLPKEGLIRNSQWVSLNEQDADYLALFLTGGDTSKHINHYDMEGNSILRRFLDPTSASSSNEIVENDDGIEFERIKMNGHAMNSQGEMSCNKNGNIDRWDLEANEATAKSFFITNELRGFYHRINLFGFLNNLRTMYWSKVNGDYTKRLKDGEEQRHSLRGNDISREGNIMGLRLEFGCRSFQGLCSRFQMNVMNLGSYLGARYQRIPYHVQVNGWSMQIILTAIFTLILLGLLVSRIT